MDIMRFDLYTLSRQIISTKAKHIQIRFHVNHTKIFSNETSHICKIVFLLLICKEKCVKIKYFNYFKNFLVFGRFLKMRLHGHNAF